MNSRRLPLLPLVLALGSAQLAALAAAEELAYQVPDKVVAQLVDAPRNPTAWLGPDRRTAVLATPRAFPGIAEIAETELRLGGVRLNPKNRSTARRNYYQSLALLDVGAKGGEPRAIGGLPAESRLADVLWSPDGRRLSLTVTAESEIELWTVDVAAAQASRLSSHALVGGLGNPCRWLPDSSALLCRVVPAGAAPAPAGSTVPKGPVVRENDGAKRPARTNPNLLTSPHDEKLFEHYLTSQLALVALDGSSRSLGAPAIWMALAPSPDGRYLLVEDLHRPFSYHVDLGRFPLRTQVWTLAGEPVSEIADLPLAEQMAIDFDAVRTGRRDVDWRADAPATLCWSEARDGGDPNQAAEVRDELLCLAAPFNGSPVSLAKVALRLYGVTWGNGGLALVEEGWWKDRKTRTWVVAPERPSGAPLKLWDRSSEDRYSDPGAPVMRRLANGRYVLHVTPDGKLLLNGEGASPEGDRPFLDRLDPATGKSERLWRSSGETYAWVSEVLDERGTEVLIWRQSPSTPSQLYLTSLGRGGKAKERQLTRFPHPVPELAGVQKQLVRWKRPDGVEMSGMVLTPPGFRPGVDPPLPVLVWVYPAEYKSAAAASQVSGSPYEFTYPSWGGPLFALTQGFAVVDGPNLPIVGEGTAEPNDTYVAQLTADATAMVDEVVRLGIGDRDRFAIGGHSYGAFTTANALAHTDLFRAGIARSGAYNRTLTPFGFQSEERNYWQAPDTYMAMSPFRYAGQIDEPLLLIHGAADDNQGTYPIQSDRLFDAMQGLGGRVRYVSLPAEAHGYRARESTLHVLWEEVRFLEEKVKKAGPRAAN